MADLAAGDENAFVELLRRYEAAILTLCYSFMRNREAAEDMAQETFLRVFRNACKYEPIAKFTTWLYRIGTNLCINELKKSKLRAHRSLDEPAGPNPDGSRIVSRIASLDPQPVSLAERAEIQHLIDLAIKQLPDDQRITLTLVEYHHLSYQEVAEILDVTVSAIKMRVKRSRETLRSTLKILQAQAMGEL